MKYTEFQSLTNVETPAAALLLADGTKFLFNETQIHGQGQMAGYGNQGNSQQRSTALRHKIQYYVRDTSDVGYHPVYDILESDTLTQQTKTATRKGKNLNNFRDDDERRDIISETPWA